LTSVVIGIYSILELVSSVNESVVVGDFTASIFDFTRTRNADVGDAFVVVVCSVLITAKKNLHNQIFIFSEAQSINNYRS